MEIGTFLFDGDGRIPNNPRLPLVLYRGAVDGPVDGGDRAAAFEALFARHGWRGSWRNGIYDHHHFHATTHEVLGIACGTVTVRFGGEHGQTVTVKAGDAVVIPAGVGHCNLSQSRDLLVVGAYPEGRSPDMKTGTPAEHARALLSIPDVPLPAADPVTGGDGPIAEHWRMRC